MNQRNDAEEERRERGDERRKGEERCKGRRAPQGEGNAARGEECREEEMEDERGDMR